MDLEELKKELSKKGLKRFAYIKVELGTPYYLLNNENDEKNRRLLDDKNIKIYNGSFLCSDLRDLKGINYGKYELSFLHPAILLTNIPSNKLPPNNIMIIPMVSANDNTRKYKSSYHDFEISREYNSSLANPFLDNNSILRVGEIKTIGIERINIKETLKNNENFKLLWHKDRELLIEKVIKTIKAE